MTNVASLLFALVETRSVIIYCDVAKSIVAISLVIYAIAKLVRAFKD